MRGAASDQRHTLLHVTRAASPTGPNRADRPSDRPSSRPSDRSSRQPAGQPARPARPALLAVVCLLTLLEAAAALGLGLGLAADLVRGRVQSVGASTFLVVCALGIALLLSASARGLWRGRRWARSPVMTFQVLLVVLGVGWVGADPAPWTWGVLAVALVVAVALFVPAVVAATTGRGEQEPPRGDAPGTRTTGTTGRR